MLKYADVLGEVRVFFSDTIYSYVARLLKSFISNTFSSNAQVLNCESQVSPTRFLYIAAEELIRRNRTDAAINFAYSGDPFGAVLAAAEELNIIKPD